MNSVSYMPLARKYRPNTFAELCGQNATASALANAIRLGREPHAVIFSGVRGIGKTTSARLYAKALNCEHPTAAEPCNNCESCKAISSGTHEDVMEIDGASNTSVDDVRALRETVSYVPQRSRFKVYIIDEVHMLSQSAFNALLKTLEEPPPHVVFIFATTELQKIPQTIMSRCQVFHLQKLSLAAIRERLAEILSAESITYDDKALQAIAREGHGSMRDALTLLDHVIAVGEGKVTTQALEKIISHVSSTQFLKMLDGLVCRDPAALISCLDELEDAGVNMKDVAEKTALMARHAFILRDVGTDAIDFRAIGFDDEEARQLNDIALRAGPSDLNRIFRTISKARMDLDGAELDRYILENYCLEWCLDPGLLAHHIAVGGAKNAHLTSRSSPASSGTNAHPMISAPRKSVAEIRESLSSKSQPMAHSSVSENAASVKPPMTELKHMGTTAEDVAPTAAPKCLPKSWRDCVEVWKKYRPLQAKKLEDVHPLTYSEKSIELVIPADSYLSATLLKIDEQKKLRESFLELFGYSGPIVFKPKSAATPVVNEGATESHLPETLSSITQRENTARREQATTDAENNPITKDAMRLFNATIESVEITRDR